MGVSIQQWRAVIGCFSQPLKVRTRLKTLSLKYVSLSVRILLFFLLVVEGVEANPGPLKVYLAVVVGAGVIVQGH